jgi:hypothetical protein
VNGLHPLPATNVAPQKAVKLPTRTLHAGHSLVGRRFNSNPHFIV